MISRSPCQSFLASRFDLKVKANGTLRYPATDCKWLQTQGRSVFRSFNPEPTATAMNRGKCAVAVGSGLNEIYPTVKNCLALVANYRRLVKS